jgi:hypothetical protein
MIVSVWSSYGHRFVSSDSDDSDSCLTCGALYALVETPDGPSDGEYQAADGSEPAECTGDTRMVHGYPGERWCEECRGAGCEHCQHNCNCILCDS